MTLNELKAIFDNDDLNPNVELIFDAGDRLQSIDDISRSQENIFIYLKVKNDIQ